MIGQIPSWIVILILAIYGLCFVLCWISGIREMSRIAKSKTERVLLGTIPEPFMPYEILRIEEIIETLPDSFDGYDC